MLGTNHITIGLLAIGLIVSLFVQHTVWQNFRDTELYRLGAEDPATYRPRDLQPDAAHQAASRMIYLFPYDAPKIRQLIDHSLRWRPSYAPAWLNKAEFLYRENDIQGATLALDKAEKLWPTRGPMLWRIAGLRIMLEDNDGAIETLRKFVSANPAGIEQAIALVLLIEPDRDAAVDHVTHDIAESSGISLLLATKLTNVALRSEDLLLAKAIWNKSVDTIKTNSSLVRAHYRIRWLKGSVEDLLAMWRDIHGSDREFGRVSNGDFAEKLEKQLLSWLMPPSEGVKVRRDRSVGYSERTSLRVAFDGTFNIAGNLAIQILPIESNKKYELSGFWKGEEVTTRSGVIVDLVRHRKDPKIIATTDSKTGSWDWEPFNVPFETDTQTEFIEVRIRRSSTQALDRLIDGDVWLDDIKITPIEEKQVEESMDRSR